MATRIRLRRMGAKKAPFYRIVVADSRYPRDGRFIEEIGYYDPTKNPSLIKIDEERAKYWMGTGAQPSDTVKSLMVAVGIMDKSQLRPYIEKPSKAEAAAAEAAATAAAEPEAKAEAVAVAAVEEAAPEAEAAIEAVEAEVVEEVEADEAVEAEVAEEAEAAEEAETEDAEAEA